HVPRATSGPGVALGDGPGTSLGEAQIKGRRGAEPDGRLVRLHGLADAAQGAQPRRALDGLVLAGRRESEPRPVLVRGALSRPRLRPERRLGFGLVCYQPLVLRWNG